MYIEVNLVSDAEASNLHLKGKAVLSKTDENQNEDALDRKDLINA